MAEYQHKTIKMNPSGMSLAYPPDSMPEDLFPVLINTRFDRNGVITKRNALANQVLPSPVTGNTYAIRRLKYDTNDYRIFHIGNKLVLHNLLLATLTVLDTGFADAFNSTSIVSIRPEESIGPYLYIANTNRFKKFSFDGDYNDVGISAPNSPCVAKVAPSIEKIVDEITSVGYTNGGAAGVLVTVNRVPITTTVSAFIFDSGSNGWVSIVPNILPSALQSRTILLISDTTIPVLESIIVDDIVPAYLVAGVATITSIKYDSGVSGDCTIQLSITPEDIREDAILLLGGSEYVRVKAVIDSVSQGNNAIRVSTIGTFAAGAIVEGKASIRAFLQNTGYTITNTTLFDDALKIPFAASGTGYAQKVSAIDLSRISNRPVADTDVLRFAVLVSNTTALDEGQIQLDLSRTGGNFDNYIYYPFTPSSLTQSYKQLAASTLAQQQFISRLQLRREYLSRVNSRTDASELVVNDSLLDLSDQSMFDIEPISVPNELNLGDFQWTVFEIPISQFLQNRVGSDATRTLKDISAIRFSFRVNNAVDIYVDSFSIGGTYDLISLDSDGNINGYYWTYRYRSSKTRAVSSFAPPNRDSKFIHRGRGQLTFIPSSDNQVDKIDIYRFGGRLTDFYYIGTKDNDANIFYDELADVNAIQNPIADFNYYKPFTLLDKSRTGICNVIGTEVSFISGSNFNTAWARGSQIIINGVPNSLYNSPTSTTKLTLNKSVGNLTSATFYLPAPRLVGQTLPTIFGPYGEGNLGLIVFGLGNINAKGTIYWLDGNSPDTMHDINSLEITSPDEPLVDGCIYRNIPYVFTNKRGFALKPRVTNDGILTFYAELVEEFRGVRTKGNIAIAESMFITSIDGIYSFDGGNVKLISNDIQPLFPRDGINAVAWTLGEKSVEPLTIAPILNTSTTTLTAYRNYLYFYSRDIATTPGMFVYDITRQRFVSIDISEVFLFTCIVGDDSQYTNELVVGIANGYCQFTTVYFGANVEYPVQSLIFTPSYDFGDGRILKEFYEVTLDAGIEYNATTLDTALGVSPFINNYDTLIAGLPLISPTTSIDAIRKKTLLEFPSIQLAYNIGFKIIIVGAGKGWIYELQPSFLVKGEKIRHRFTDWNNGGFGGTKILKELIVEADTFGQTIILELQGDGGVVIQTFDIVHDGQERIVYSIPDNYTILFRIRQNGSNKDWILYNLDIRFKEAPDNIDSPSNYLETETIQKKYLQRVIIDADTGGEDILVDIETDEGIIAVTNIVINHDGRGIKSYDFPPVIGYLFRLVPKSPTRIFNVDWKFDLEPEGQKIWRTQPTTHDVPGYQIVRETILALKSTTIVTYTVIIDGISFDYMLDSTEGMYRKVPIPMKAIKGQIFEYKIQSVEEVIVAQKDCEVHVHSITNGEEVIKNPFGHISREVGTA
jgi:hypothetical protein